MKKQFISIVLIVCVISLSLDYAIATTNKAALLKKLYTCAIKGESCVAKEITLDSRLKDVKKKFGEPKEKLNDEWGALFVYDTFSILLTDWLNEVKDESQILEIRIYIDKYNIYYKDLIKILGTPDHKMRNYESSGEWEIYYKAGDNCLGFYTGNIENGRVGGAAIFTPSEELRKQFKTK